MGRRKIAEIEWTYPRVVDSAIKSDVCKHSWGLYYISRKFGDKETLLYIGLTFDQNFINRILNHQVSWFNIYRGEKRIRFGEFIKPRGITKDVIEDIESCLIYELMPMHNQRKIYSYSCSNEYELLNTGYRGVIPKKISMFEH